MDGIVTNNCYRREGMDLKQTEIQSLLKIHSKFKGFSILTKLPVCPDAVENDSEADVEDEVDPPKQL